MDSRRVNKAIKEVIKPVLVKNGFTRFTSRSAWRDSEETVEIINFQSFSSYLAEGVGCTTYSFAINLGVYYKCFEKTPWFKGEARHLPNDYQCLSRKRLDKQIKQAKLFHPYGNYNNKDISDIWYILENGSNLNEVIEDAKETIITYGFPWLSQNTDINYALKTYQKITAQSVSWADAEIMSALAIHLNMPEQAIKAYEGVMNNPFYIHIHQWDSNNKAPSEDDYYVLASKRINFIKRMT